MSEREALKLALEALETGLCYVENEDFDNKQKFRGYEHLMPTDAAESIQEIKTAIAAVKEALAQPEQEPYAWEFAGTIFHDRKEVFDWYERGDISDIPPLALYTTPPQPKEPEQEPVAWMRDDEMKAMTSLEKDAWIECGRGELVDDYNKPLGYLSKGGAERLLTKKQAIEHIKNFKLFNHDVPIYTTPPQRTWVGLTEEEVEACFHHVDEAGIGLFDFAEAIEAKLKQKNGYAEEKNT